MFTGVLDGISLVLICIDVLFGVKSMNILFNWISGIMVGVLAMSRVNPELHPRSV
jgi:hypothetical protein